MREKFFSVIVPTYNSAKTLDRAISSITKQTFKDYELIIADDCSADKTGDMLQALKLDNLTIIRLGKKGYNGGTRNKAIIWAKGRYTLFLDADDEYIDDRFFEKLHNFIIENNEPDMVRLPYIRHYDETGRETIIDLKRFNEKGLADVAKSPRVACWTKAVKTRLLCYFPGNTLMEDVCQHLSQCDMVSTVAWYSEPVVRWHLHSESTSHNGSPKWESSAWRFVADLMDLDLRHPYTRARRDEKVRAAKENLRKGIIQQ